MLKEDPGRAESKPVTRRVNVNKGRRIIIADGTFIALGCVTLQESGCDVAVARCNNATPKQLIRFGSDVAATSQSLDVNGL